MVNNIKKMEATKTKIKKNERPFDTCRLCLQKKLLCKSHIITNAIYRRLKIHGDHHKFKFKNPITGKLDDRLNGIWEYLLCEECEMKLKVNEDPTIELIFNHESPNGKQLYDSRQEVFYQNYNAMASVFGWNDFSYFRKFILGVLWKASISKRKEFNHVKLDENSEEELRNWILNDEIGNPHKYAFNCLSIYRNNDAKDNVIFPFIKFLDNKSRSPFYLFGMGGLLFQIDYSNNCYISIIQDAKVTNTVFPILHVSYEYLLSFIQIDNRNSIFINPDLATNLNLGKANNDSSKL